MVSWLILRSASRSWRSSGGRPLALQALLAALQEVVPPGRQPVRLDPKFRDSASNGSPRSSLSTASVFLPADHLGRAR